jgi:hypothetical protein
MSKNPVPDLVCRWTVLYWHRVYEIILAEYEWKHCAGPVDAGRQSYTGTGFTKLFWLNMTGNPVQNLVMQVDRSCNGTGFTK